VALVPATSVGSAASGEVLSATVTLDNAAIKLLPAGSVAAPTYTAVVAAPAASAILVPILSVVTKNFAAAYTDVVSDASVGLILEYHTGAVAPVGPRTAFFLQETNWSFFGSTGAEQYLLPAGSSSDGNGGVFPPGGRDLRGQPLGAWMVNNSGGAQTTPLTGGDAANVLTITVYYQTLAGL
jgi:hypothetical protein